jgi:Arc/MetJ family transcription regulator
MRKTLKIRDKTMQTSVVLDSKLLTEAMRYSGLTTERAVVEEALRLLMSLKAQEQVRELKGQLRWEGDLEAMRLSRFQEEQV